jgi:hypothetical protein
MTSDYLFKFTSALTESLSVVIQEKVRLEEKQRAARRRKEAEAEQMLKEGVYVLWTCGSLWKTTFFSSTAQKPDGRNHK